MVFDKLLSFLTEDLSGGAPPIEDVVWGKHTSRLPPTPAQIWAVETSGRAEPLPPAEPLHPPPEDLVSLASILEDWSKLTPHTDSMALPPPLL